MLEITVNRCHTYRGSLIESHAQKNRDPLFFVNSSWLALCTKTKLKNSSDCESSSFSLTVCKTCFWLIRIHRLSFCFFSFSRQRVINCATLRGTWSVPSLKRNSPSPPNMSFSERPNKTFKPHLMTSHAKCHEKMFNSMITIKTQKHMLRSSYPMAHL